MRVFVPRDNGDGTAQYEGNSYVDIDLYDENDEPLWYEKSINDRMVDVALLPIENPDFCYMAIDAAEESFNENVKIEIASEIYIIGFPFAKQTGYVPI